MSGDGWCAVALSADIEAGSLAGTRIEGDELVVWRDHAGTAHIWEDRCPHRGMRLSLGFVRDDHLACLYHGWQFDGSGQCRLIPAHPALEVPATIRTNIHECAERLGMIWMRHAAGTSALPADDAQAIPLRSIAIACDAVRLLAALPDHPPAAAATVQGSQDGMLAWFRSQSWALAAAVQPVAPGQSILHLSLSGAPGASVRLAVNGWAEALRDRLEAAQ